MNWKPKLLTTTVALQPLSIYNHSECITYALRHPEQLQLAFTWCYCYFVVLVVIPARPRLNHFHSGLLYAYDKTNEYVCAVPLLFVAAMYPHALSLSLPLRCLRSVWRCLFDSAQFVRSVCVCVIYTSAVRSNVGKGRECTHQNCCHGMRVSIYVCSCSAIDSRLQLALYVNSCTFWPIHGCCSKLNNRPIWMKNPNEMVHRACFFSSWSRFWFDQEVRTSNSRVSWRFCSSCVGH